VCVTAADAADATVGVGVVVVGGGGGGDVLRCVVFSHVCNRAGWKM
jgi:hypothetical protein